MERTKSTRIDVDEGSHAPEGWEAWDAVPRDGPAVFVVDTAALDHGIVSGRWLEVTDDQDGLHAELSHLLGREPEEGTWAVVDQVGLGPVMAPEVMTVNELTTISDDLRPGSAG